MDINIPILANGPNNAELQRNIARNSRTPNQQQWEIPRANPEFRLIFKFPELKWTRDMIYNNVCDTPSIPKAWAEQWVVSCSL